MGWFLSLTAFFSGCLPISCITLFTNLDNEIILIKYFSFSFFAITAFATVYFAYWLHNNNNTHNSIIVKIINIKRKNLFSTGAMTYYIVPFISFIPGDNIKTLYILIVLLGLFAILFITNRMALYTPIIDLCGYKILECDIKLDSGKLLHSDIIIKNIDGLCFSGENAINVRKIDESTYFAYYKKED